MPISQPGSTVSSTVLIQVVLGSFPRQTGFSFRSTPWTWNTFFAKSTPIRISFMVDSFSLLTGGRHFQSGTSMPLG
jgi:hypothetical protein